MPPIAMEDPHVRLIEEGVPEHHQTMTWEKTFWAFFTTNMGLANWLVGVFIAGLSLDFLSAFAAIILGAATGSIAPALIATMGPKTGLSQLESSRTSFGKAGARLPSLLNWINSIGWDAINNVPAAVAFIALLSFTNYNLPFWLALGALVLVQMVIGVYGHHFVQWISKYIGSLLLVAFIVIGFFAVSYAQTNGVAITKSFSLNDFILAFSFAAVTSYSFVPYGSDYTRYLPKDTPSRWIFWPIFLALFISALLLLGLGFITASAITDQTPLGVILSIKHIAGNFAPFFFLVILISTIPANAFNDNSAAYCLISSGIRVSRPIAAIFGGITGYALAAYGAGKFTAVFENYLLFLFYWMMPWGAIMLVHWFAGNREDRSYAKGWSTGATIFCIVTVLTVALFASTEIYTGPIAKMLGGVDIGYYVGFVLAGGWYWAVLKGRKTTLSS